MLYGEERKAHILAYVQRHHRASVQELSQRFGVSESTIRRDLKELEEANLLRRTHGGALALRGVAFEPTFGEKEDQFRREKEAIAAAAATLIEDGDTILLDSGTTVYHMVRHLVRFSRLTVVTNSLVFARELLDHPGIELVVVGGILRHNTLALVGPLAEQALDGLRVDKAFMATNGLDIREGLTTPNLLEAATKRKMIRSAKQVYLLADHSKIGNVAFAKFADITELDTCILDDGAPEGFVTELRERGVDVILAPVREERE